MAVFIDTYDSLNQINLTDKNEKLEFKNQTFTTDQGLNLKSYKLFSNTIDSLEKNYTYNNLSEDKNIADFATFEKPPFIQDLNTKLGFYATSPQLSSSGYIKVVSNLRDDPSQITLDGALPGSADQNLLVDSRKWFAVVLNISNEYQTLNLNIWEMQFDATKPAYVQQTTQLKLIFGETKSFNKQAIKSNSFYELKGSPIQLTNIRLLTELINEENQPLMLNRYTVRDNQYARMIDNALPPLQMTREPVR